MTIRFMFVGIIEQPKLRTEKAGREKAGEMRDEITPIEKAHRNPSPRKFRT
jgi:hypothetical protein